MKSFLTTAALIFFLLFANSSFAQDNDVIYLDENTFNETFGDLDFSNGEGVSSNLDIANLFNSISENIAASQSTSPESIPVDGGLSFLLAAGLGYGANRLRKQRNQRKADLS